MCMYMHMYIVCTLTIQTNSVCTLTIQTYSVCTLTIQTYSEYTCTYIHAYNYIYMKIHVPSMLAIGVEMINKQTQQTNKHPQWLIKFIKHSHKGLRKY